MDIFDYIDITKINTHYWNRYKKFINYIFSLGKRSLNYTEHHHIIPRCINVSLYTNPDNIISLTAREHFIAHKMLSYCFLDHTVEYNKLMYAFNAMSNLKMKYHERDDINITSREYEKLKIRYGKCVSIRMKTAITTGKWDKFIGKGQPSAIRGKISITNGVVNKFINPADTIPEGWYKGNTQIKTDESKQKWRQNLVKSWDKNRESRIGKNHPMYGKGYLISRR